LSHNLTSTKNRYRRFKATNNELIMTVLAWLMKTYARHIS
jgi:hypothetical protein